MAAKDMKQLQRNKFGTQSPQDHWVRPILREEAGQKCVTLGTNTHAPRISAGPLKVLWPNGTIEDVVVVIKRETAKTKMLGESYSITSNIPYISVNHNGAKIDVELVKSNVRVWKDN